MESPEGNYGNYKPVSDYSAERKNKNVYGDRLVNDNWYKLLKIGLIVFAILFVGLLYLVYDGAFKTECPSCNCPVSPACNCPDIEIPACPICNCPTCTNNCNFPDKLEIVLDEEE